MYAKVVVITILSLNYCLLGYSYKRQDLKMSTSAPEDMGKASVVTPHSLQEFTGPTSDSIDPTSAPAAPAMKSLLE